MSSPFFWRNVAVLLGFLYELPQRGSWRFAYALILGGWLVRLVSVLKTRA